MKYLHRKLGTLALASRFRIISEMLMYDVKYIYSEQNIEFEPRWFLMFYLLKLKPAMAITEIAEKIKLTHAAVNQIAAELEEKDLITSEIDITDKRKRLLSLSPKGEKLIEQLKPVWNDIDISSAILVDSIFPDLLKILDKMENALETKSMYTRINEQIRTRQWNDIEILNYTKKLKKYFKLINKAWLEKYFSVEKDDEKLLDNPDIIINEGGKIVFAKYEGEIAGCCALINKGDNCYELAKMGVLEKFQGKQIGKKLALAIIEEAKQLNATNLYLITHPDLESAIKLYKKIGFRKTKNIHNNDYLRKGFEMIYKFKK